MAFQEVLDSLKEIERIEVNQRLSQGERKALEQGYCFHRAYQDQPSDKLYPFRPVKYCLIRSDWYNDQLKRR